MNMNIAVLTTIEPDKYNRNGPSGLLWEIIAVLERLGCMVEVCLYKQKNTSAICSHLSIMGLMSYQAEDSFINLENKDFLLVYPDVLLYSINSNVYEKTILLAPDATSMVRLRKYLAYKNEKQRIVSRIYQYLFYKRFLCFENKYIPRVLKYVVVGINDRRWLLNSCDKNSKKKISFLRHPLLSGSMIELVANKYDSEVEKRFVFAGDMSFSYIGDNVRKIADALEQNLMDKKINILVLGKKNKWIHDIFKLKENINAKYIEWLDNYGDVCLIGKDVHCVPLLTGAGTKNRVVTAIANGVEVITTSIGIENVIHHGLQGVFVINDMGNFAKKMIDLNNGVMSLDEQCDIIRERQWFREKTTEEFTKTLINLFGLR